jgi:hypothetical protein
VLVLGLNLLVFDSMVFRMPSIVFKRYFVVIVTLNFSVLLRCSESAHSSLIYVFKLPDVL